MQASVHEAKTHFTRLVARVLAGEDVVVAKNGKPLVRITAFSTHKGERKPGLSTGSATVSEGFDESLSPEILQEFEK